MDGALLHHAVVKNLSPLIGKPLKQVVYRCLQGEANPADVYHPAFYLGGEVELQFAHAAPVYVTWDQNAGWSDYFSVKVANMSAFLPETLVPLDASSTPLWKPHIGHVLLGCSVLGWDDIPHVVSFRFEAGAVLVGDGSQGRAFGDGDDVFARSDVQASQLPEMSGAQVLWESPRAAGGQHT